MSQDRTVTTYHSYCFLFYKKTLYRGQMIFSSDACYGSRIEVESIPLENAEQAANALRDAFTCHKDSYNELPEGTYIAEGNDDYQGPVEHRVKALYQFAFMIQDSASYDWMWSVFETIRDDIQDSAEPRALSAVEINPVQKTQQHFALSTSESIPAFVQYSEDKTIPDYAESDVKHFCATVLHDVRDEKIGERLHQRLLEQINLAIEEHARACQQNATDFTSLGFFGSRSKASVQGESVSAPAFIEHIQRICQGKTHSDDTPRDYKQDVKDILGILKNEDPKNHYWITRFIKALFRALTGRWQTQQQVDCAASLEKSIRSWEPNTHIAIRV